MKQVQVHTGGIVGLDTLVVGPGSKGAGVERIRDRNRNGFSKRNKYCILVAQDDGVTGE